MCAFFALFFALSCPVKPLYRLSVSLKTLSFARNNELVFMGGEVGEVGESPS
jgi:hypothetical protein